jgi:hypothetical protein
MEDLMHHPALFQKEGKYGMSTYSKEDIPVGTIIIREKIKNIHVLTRESDEYPFALIAEMIKTNADQFDNLTPFKLDATIDINYETIRERHEKYLPLLSREDAILAYAKYKRNAFSFNMNPGFLFYATKLNHSCMPHVKYYPSDNNMMVFETIRPIKANDEVFDSYINSWLPYEERQQLLMKRYGFKCMCEKCKKGSN